MPSKTSSTAQTRQEFSFTELSTLQLLIGIGAACAVLWGVIAATVGL